MKKLKLKSEVVRALKLTAVVGGVSHGCDTNLGCARGDSGAAACEVGR